MNDGLEASPELINDQPYGGGWIFEIEVDGEYDGEYADAVKGLLDAAGYSALVAE
ncbi:Glycine cleavage system H protein [compost metagenome]